MKVYNVEIREAGVWNSVFVTTNLAQACREASFLIENSCFQEKNVRILNEKNKEL